MGQRSATETLFGIISAFIERPTWSQAELARRLETRPETIRRQMNELLASGFKLEQEKDHPHVYWSVPRNWFPGALAFKSEEVGDLLRLIGRAPRGQLRERVLGRVVERLANLGKDGKGTFDANAVRPPALDVDEERWLAILEDAAGQRVPVMMRYFTASRREDARRHVSVHRVELGSRPHFIATCHRANALRRFRITGMSDAKLDPAVAFLPVDPEELDRFERESLGGFHEEGPLVACSFFVRAAEASWVTRNLPEGSVRQERSKDGTTFHFETTAVTQLARFVVGLGEAARPETRELARAVADLARGALASTGEGSSPFRG